MTRREARLHAFALVFQLPFHTQATTEALAEAKKWYYDDMEKQERPTGKYAAYIERVVWGVFDRQAQLDGVIEKFLRDWDISRISKVDLAIMRLSIYEMLCEPDVPLGTAVNEAVEIANEYGTDDSPGFINGVLGNVSRSIKAQGRESIG